MSKYKVFLCEKPSQAMDYAIAFGLITASDAVKYEKEIRRKGEITDVGRGMSILWAQGHLVRLYNPDEYGGDFGKTRTLNDFPMLPRPFQYKVDDSPMIINGKSYPSSKQKLFNRIQDVFDKHPVDEVIISTDKGREGDTIAWLIIDKLNYNGLITRIEISDLSAETILKGYENRFPWDGISNYAKAGVARVEADWFVGMNLSRAFTIHNRDMLGSQRLPIGRVLTALVNIVVMREKEILNFKPLDYYDLNATFSKDGSDIKMNWQPKPEHLDEVEKKCLDKRIVDKIQSELTDGVVRKSEKTRKETNHPRSYNLATLSTAAFKEFKYDAPQVLALAQSLYETKKLISYPRTDCVYLPTSLFGDAKRTLDTVSGNTKNSALSKANPKYKSTTWNDKEVAKSDHHAIIPIPNPAKVSLTQDEQNLYDLISRNYIAQFLPKYEYDQTVLEVESGNQMFRVTGNIPVEFGWKEAMSEVSEKDDVLPVIDVGAVLSLKDSKVNSKKTTPPSRFDAGSIITEMNNAAKYVTDKELRKIISDVDGIGTQATQSVIYQNSIDYQYLKLDKKKTITPTKKAMLLIDSCPDDVKSVENSAHFEKMLKGIERDEFDSESFFNIQLQSVERSIDGMKQGKYKILEPVGEKCKECNSSTIVRIKSKKNGKFYWICQSDECKALFEDTKGKAGKVLNKHKPVEQGSISYDCLECSKEKLVRREGQYGFYWNCPACKTNFKDVDMKPVKTVKREVNKNFKCPDCSDGYLQERNGKSKFWGCSGFPKCRTTKQDKDGKPEGF